MNFIQNLVFKKYLYKKLMINAIIFSMLESPSTSDYDEMYNSFLNQQYYNLQQKNYLKKQSFAVGQHTIWQGEGKYNTRNISNGKNYPERNEMLINK